STAAGLHAGNLVNLAGSPDEALAQPAKTSQAIKSMTGAYRDISDYAAELESRPEPDLELRELANSDPQGAARQALAQFMVSGTGRTGDRIAAARAVLSTGAEDDTGNGNLVDLAAEALADFPPEVRRALAARLAQAGDA